MEKTTARIVVRYIRTDNTPRNFDPAKDHRVVQRHVCRNRREAERIVAQLKLLRFIKPESIEITEE